TLAEAEALAFVAQLRERDALLSLYHLDGAGGAEAAYRAVWTTRALATRAIAIRREVAGRSAEARSAWERLNLARSRLADEVSGPAGRPGRGAAAGRPLRGVRAAPR